MKKLLVSFSGGETSAYMAQWLWNHKRNDFEMIFVFANTGQENEETLEFVEKCSNHFGFPVVWVEAKVYPEMGKGNTFKIVDFESADRSGQTFEAAIAKHGIPNTNTPHCTRELKQVPINKFARSLGWKSYYTAIGIRSDEADRINSKAKQLKLIYPLVSREMQPMTKPKINFWWSQQPFRLNLKGYQGNCKWCWKKGNPKLYQIAKETPQFFYFPALMEKKYGEFVPESRLKKMNDRGEKPLLPVRFFRQNRSVNDIINEAEKWEGSVFDDSRHYAIQHDLFEDNDLIGGESCEVFSECGS